MLWVRRYAESVTAENGRLPVSVDLVKGFSRSLLQSGIPAWQRKSLGGIDRPERAEVPARDASGNAIAAESVGD